MVNVWSFYGRSTVIGRDFTVYLSQIYGNKKKLCRAQSTISKIRFQFSNILEMETENVDGLKSVIHPLFLKSACEIYIYNADRWQFFFFEINFEMLLYNFDKIIIFRVCSKRKVSIIWYGWTNYDKVWLI